MPVARLLRIRRVPDILDGQPGADESMRSGWWTLELRAEPPAGPWDTFGPEIEASNSAILRYVEDPFDYSGQGWGNVLTDTLLVDMDPDHRRQQPGRLRDPGLAARGGRDVHRPAHRDADHPDLAGCRRCHSRRRLPGRTPARGARRWPQRSSPRWSREMAVPPWPGGHPPPRARTRPTATPCARTRACSTCSRIRRSPGRARSRAWPTARPTASWSRTAPRTTTG